jgi:hypothetical protein
MTSDPPRPADLDMRGRPVKIATLCLLGLVVIAALVITVQPNILAYDEALILYGASRVLHGDVPYRDFWTLYGPGSYYVVRLFGESVAAGRGFDLAARVAIVLTAYAIVRRTGRVKLALLTAGVECLLMVVTEQPESVFFPAIASILLALYFLADGPMAPGAPARAAAAGAFAGAAFLFRTDLGVYCGLACAVLVQGLSKRSTDRHRSHRWSRSALVALGLVVVPVMTAFAFIVPWHDLSDDLVRIPLLVYPEMRALPWPDWTTIPLRPSNPQSLERIVYAPLLATFVCAAVMTQASRRSMLREVRLPADAIVCWSVVVLSALLMLKGFIRVSPYHMASGLIASTLALALTYAAPNIAAPARWVLGVTAAICLWPLLGPAHSFAQYTVHAMKSAAHGELPIPVAELVDACLHPALPRLRCARTDDNRLFVARFLIDHAPTDRPVYVGAGRHDKLFVNDVLLYFLSGTFAPTKWYDLHPGVQTTAAVQSTMIDDMKRRPPAWVIRNIAWDNHQEPNQSRFSSGVTMLDDYLDRSYVAQFTIGSYIVERPVAAPLP